MKDKGLKPEYFMPYIENGVWRFDPRDAAIACMGKKVVGVAGSIMHGPEHMDNAARLGEHPDRMAEVFAGIVPSKRSMKILTGMSGMLFDHLREQDISIAYATTHPNHPFRKIMNNFLGFEEISDEPIMVRGKFSRILMRKDIGFKPWNLDDPQIQQQL